MEAHGKKVTIYCDAEVCRKEAKYYPHLEGWYCDEHANMNEEEIQLWEEEYKAHRLMDTKNLEHE